MVGAILGSLGGGSALRLALPGSILTLVELCSIPRGDVDSPQIRVRHNATRHEFVTVVPGNPAELLERLHVAANGAFVKTTGSLANGAKRWPHHGQVLVTEGDQGFEDLMLAAGQGTLANGTDGRTTGALSLMTITAFVILGQHAPAWVAMRATPSRVTNRQAVAAATARRDLEQINVFNYLAGARIKCVTRAKIGAIVVIDRQVNQSFQIQLPSPNGSWSRFRAWLVRCVLLVDRVVNPGLEPEALVSGQETVRVRARFRRGAYRRDMEPAQHSC